MRPRQFLLDSGRHRKVRGEGYPGLRRRARSPLRRRG